MKISMPMLRTLASVAGLAIACSSLAQGYPSKPIRLVVPYSPGGATDQLARAVQKPLSDILGQTVIIDNKAGAGGAIGVEAVARAEPDGYTLVFGNSGPSASVSLMRSLSYDPLEDFQPISTVALVPLALVVADGMPVNTLGELIDYAKKNKGKLNYGSVGVGSLSHLTGEYFNNMAGTDIQHVPYKGGSLIGIGIMSGEIETAWVNPLDGTPIVATGKARYVAIGSEKRFADLPDVPTVAETLPGFKSTAWFGILAPKGVPQDVVETLNNATVKAVERPEVVRALTAHKAEPKTTTPGELEQIIRDELAQWGPVVEKADIKL